MIETIFSTGKLPKDATALRWLAAQRRRAPFAYQATSLVATLSQRILRAPLAREYPELAALGHWFRRANLEAFKASLQEGARTTEARARGVVFAIAPANVEVLFIYAWLLSLLTGNGSVIRVSQRPNPLRDAFLSFMTAMAAEREFAGVLDDSWIITYPHDAKITAAISEACDARLIWGGDATVGLVRSIPLKPVAVEAAFADRFSIAAFAAQAVLTSEPDALRELARKFANDTLWFSQQACSSPRVVFWVGEKRDCAAARTRFWTAFEAASASFPNEPASVMSRVADFFMLAGGDAIVGVETGIGSFPGRALGSATLGDIRDIHSGHGLFIEYDASMLAGLSSFLQDKDQTLVAHGFEDGELRQLVDALPNRAIDRIVAPGRATDFSIVWDGLNLLDLFTRKVEVTRRPGATAI